MEGLDEVVFTGGERGEWDLVRVRAEVYAVEIVFSKGKRAVRQVFEVIDVIGGRTARGLLWLRGVWGRIGGVRWHNGGGHRSRSIVLRLDNAQTCKEFRIWVIYHNNRDREQNPIATPFKTPPISFWP